MEGGRQKDDMSGRHMKVNALGKLENKSRDREEKESRHSDWSHWYIGLCLFIL